MKTPLVTIVLPTFNGSRYLEDAIESCLTQTYDNWELIVVDDASTDGTPHIISRFMERDRRIRVIRHERNRKLPAALNTGFAACHGEYLTWTSDDNCYRPHALETMISFLDRNPDIAMTYCDFSVIDSSGTITGRKQTEDSDLLHTVNCIGPCFLYRRHVYQNIGGYDESMFLVEDYDYWLRMATRYRLVPLHEDLYLFREHGHSLTSSRKKEISMAVEKVLRSNMSSITLRGSQPIVETHLRIARLAICNSQPVVMMRHIFAAACTSPCLFSKQVLRSLKPCKVVTGRASTE